MSAIQLACSSQVQERLTLSSVFYVLQPWSKMITNDRKTHGSSDFPARGPQPGAQTAKRTPRGEVNGAIESLM